MVLEMVIMKRYSLFILSLFLLLSTICNAQEQQQVTVKDYSAYLPKSGDVAISANLNPLATYAGQLFNGTLANSLKEFGGQPYYNNDVRDYNVLPADLISISLKYMVTDNFATRINFGYGLMLINNKQYVYDDAALQSTLSLRRKLLIHTVLLPIKDRYILEVNIELAKDDSKVCSAQVSIM